MKVDLEYARKRHLEVLGMTMKSKKEKAKEVNDWVMECLKNEKVFLRQYTATKDW